MPGVFKFYRRSIILIINEKARGKRTLKRARVYNLQANLARDLPKYRLGLRTN